MRIKSTQQFIREILGDKNIQVNPLKEKTKLLKKLVGDSIDINGHVKRIANFADNATLQIIFEFLQNADDANSDKSRKGLFQVYFDDEYLLVINNGKPLSIDKNGEKGSLLRFMSWDVFSEENGNYTGKFGKGSKLLYNLFVDETDKSQKIDNKRADALINLINGPIIFSWQGINGLEDLKTLDELEKFEEENIYDDDYPLLTKLINTYYPAFPGEIQKDKKGENVNLFPIEDVIKLSNFLKKYVKPDPEFIWDRGTLFFIKLGKGQKERLNFEYEGSIRSYLYFSKNISFVKINDMQIKKEKLQTTGPLEINGHKYEIAFPDIDNLKELQFVNFYNLLPVIKESHGFKFIINTRAFNIQENRQNIDFSTSFNEARLKDIVDAVENYFKNDKVDFSKKVKLFKAILLTEEDKIKKEELKAFYNDLINVLRKNIPGSNHFVSDKGMVKINISGVNADLKKLGFEDIIWLNGDLLPNKDDVKKLLNIEEWNIQDLLLNSDKENVKEWVKSLSSKEYKKIVKELSKNFQGEKLNDLLIVKDTNNNIFSINDFFQNENYLLVTEKTEGLYGVFAQLGVITSSPLFMDISNLVWADKSEINYLINFFNAQKERINRYDKFTIVSELLKWFPDYKSIISDKLEVFRNSRGEFRPLSAMLPSIDEYKPYKVFDYLKIEEAENNEILNDLFLKKENVWENIVDDWENKILKTFNGNSNFFTDEILSSLYQSLINIFNASEKRTGIKEMPVYFVSENKFVERKKVFLNSILLNFNIEEYKKMEKIFHQTEYYLPPFHLLKYLLQEPFLNDESLISDLIKRITAEIKISKPEIKVFKKLINDFGVGFFNYFVILEKRENPSLFLKKNNDIQYVSKDESLNRFLSKKENYYLLPSDLENIFTQQDGLLTGDCQEFVSKLLDEFGSQKEFVNVVLKQGDAIVRKYVDGLIIGLSSEKKYKKDSFEVKIMQHCINNNLIEELKSKIFVDGKPLAHYEYFDRVAFKEIEAVFSLSELLTEYRGFSEVISNTKENLNAVKGIHKLFSLKSKPNAEIFNNLKNQTELTVIQLSFALAYHIENDLPYWQYNTTGDQLEGAGKLNSFFKNGLSYTEYFDIDDFFPESQIYSKENHFLIEDEIVPEWVDQWVNINSGEKEKKISYLKDNLGLSFEDSSVVEIRKMIENNNDVGSDKIKELLDEINEEQKLINTLRWAKTKIVTFAYESSSFSILSKIINLCLKNCTDPKFAFFFDSFKDDNVYFKIRNINKGDYYLASDKYITKIENAENPSFKDIMFFIKCDEKAKLNEFGKTELVITKRFDANEDINKKEWDAEFYKKWKNDESVDYNGIFFSKSDLPFEYILETTEKSEVCGLGSWPDGSLAYYREKKEIYLSDNVVENKKGKEILDILEKNANEFFPEFEDKEFFRLLYSYALQGTNNGIKINLPEKDKDHLSKNASRIMAIVNNLGLENLEELLKSGKSIMELLMEKEEKAEIVQVYGYIGEALFYYYLKKNNKKNLEWTSESIENKSMEYDFVSNGLFVDVKTTIKSLKESNGAVNIYIHKKTLNFLKNNPSVKFDIVNISLADLGLSEWARGLRKRIGKNELTDDIKNEIKAKAKEIVSQTTDFEKRIIVFSLKDDFSFLMNI